MSYVEHCKKHGQYHGEICGQCFEDLETENKELKQAVQDIAMIVKTMDMIQKKWLEENKYLENENKKLRETLTFRGYNPDEELKHHEEESMNK
jgi:hypothetical protein